MNPAYFLALKLGIPIIVQPDWDECRKHIEEGWKLWEEGQKLWEEGKNNPFHEGRMPQKEGRELQKKAWRLREEGQKLYQEAVSRDIGPEYSKRIDWRTGEVK